MIVLKGKSQFTQTTGPALPAPSAIEQAAMDQRPSLWIQPAPQRVLENGAVVREVLDRAQGLGYRPNYSAAPRLITAGSAHALRFGMQGASSAPSGLAVPGGAAVMPASGTYTAAYVVRMPLDGQENTGASWPPELWTSGGAVALTSNQSWFHVLNKTNGTIGISQGGATVTGIPGTVRTGAWLSIVFTVKAGTGGAARITHWRNGAELVDGPLTTVNGIGAGDRSVIVGGDTVNPYYGELALAAIFPDVDAKNNTVARNAILDLCASVRTAVTT